jgi:2-oxo-4-hydroxy-4-carboxy--5-ureidoimidazoline (OHCU) decarboxylase
MASESLPPISTLSDASIDTRHQVLALLFEPSPSLYTKTEPILATTSFSSYDALITAVKAELQCLEASDTDEDVTSLNDILASHPRLGEKKVESSLSRAEQAAMELASASVASGSKEEEQAILKQLNQEYEEKFPGLRYV